MSWDVTLDVEDGIAQVGHHAEGGTYALTGTDDAELNVTYNYGALFATQLGGRFVDVMDGKTAAHVTPLLREAVAQLGDNPSSDYWESSKGNAGHALAILLSWAEQHPMGVFHVD